MVISSDHLDPGAIGRVKVTVATDNISGPSLKHISVYSNDHITPVLTVEVAIDVVPAEVVSKDIVTKGVVTKNVAPK